jgi:hypothetical protein
MAQLDYDKLVELITKEVLETVKGGSQTSVGELDFRPVALVLGQAISCRFLLRITGLQILRTIKITAILINMIGYT